MVRTLTLASVLALLPAAAMADHHLAGEGSAEMMEMQMPGHGLAVGETAPDVSLIMTDGTRTSLQALAGDKGVAVAFVRSADWCPFCKKQLKELEAAAGPLAESGWTLVAVSYDDPAILEGFSKDNGLSYKLLSDQGSAAIRAFNLLNTDMQEGTRYYGIPNPAILFIDTENTVRAQLMEEGYQNRPAVDLVISTAAGL